MISTDNDLMPAIYTQESAKSRALRALRAFVGHVPSWVHKNSRWSKKNSRGSKKKYRGFKKKSRGSKKISRGSQKKSRGSKKNLLGPEIFWPGSKPVRFRCCVDSNSCSENLWV